MKNMFDGMFGMVAPGMCRMSMSGKVAVKTSSGYKTYDVEKERLTNCDGFVFDVGEEFFFVVPTNKAKVGDILLIGGKPRCVRAIDGKTLSVLNFEDSTIETVLPERHVFMGNTYMYGKIMSMFGNIGKGKGMKSMMKMMMLSSMFGSNSGNKRITSLGVYEDSKDINNIQNMMAMSMMFGQDSMFDGMFEDAFDFESEDDSDDKEEE